MESNGSCHAWKNPRNVLPRNLPNQEAGQSGSTHTKRKKIENKKIFLKIVLFSIYGFPEEKKKYILLESDEAGNQKMWGGLVEKFENPAEIRN